MQILYQKLKLAAEEPVCVFRVLSQYLVEIVILVKEFEEEPEIQDQKFSLTLHNLGLNVSCLFLIETC